MKFPQHFICAVLALACFLSTSVLAVNPFADGPYPIGWYDSMAAPDDPTLIGAQGGNVTVAYWGSSSPSNRLQYLDNAAAAGVRVIMGFDDAFINPTDPVDVTGIINVVNTYKDHPAMAGWYTADEPYWVWGISFAKMQLAYDTIKSLDNKPVFIAFSEPAVERDIPIQWKTAYDQFLLDSYPARIGYPEFTGLDAMSAPYPYHSNWKADMQMAHANSQLADRPWWSIMEGWADEGAETSGYRLPTYNETRFMNYFSLSEDPAGLTHFAYYRTGNSTPAHPSEVYPYDGRQWLEDVWEPQTTELGIMGDAFQNGKIPNMVTDDTANVRSNLYVDPGTGAVYLIALNETFGDPNTTFTLNLPEHLWAVTRLFEGAPTNMPLVNGQFVDTFSDYEVHVYLLSPMPPPIPGDVNHDGQVDGLDLTFVGAYWQVSGTDWATGDLNGDGETNGLDLNIVGENWQVGVPAPGETVPEPTTLALLGLGATAMMLRRRCV
jgi:hypothetical protein